VSPILVTHKTRTQVITTRGNTDLFRFVIISRYLPRVMFMLEVKLNSPFVVLAQKIRATSLSIR
jgi:hypothetical protein